MLQGVDFLMDLAPELIAGAAMTQGGEVRKIGVTETARVRLRNQRQNLEGCRRQ
jgi:hypothetical protein